MNVFNQDSEPNKTLQKDKPSNQENENEVDQNSELDIDTYIEDTLIYNIQKYVKVKKKLVEC
jgi:hypothetical protein